MSGPPELPPNFMARPRLQFLAGVRWGTPGEWGQRGSDSSAYQKTFLEPFAQQGPPRTGSAWAFLWGAGGAERARAGKGAGRPKREGPALEGTHVVWGVQIGLIGDFNAGPHTHVGVTGYSENTLTLGHTYSSKHTRM